MNRGSAFSQLASLEVAAKNLRLIREINVRTASSGRNVQVSEIRLPDCFELKISGYS